MDIVQVQAVRLPIIPGEQVIITDRNGQMSQSFVKKIDKITYNDTYSVLYVTFSTANTTYNAPIVIARGNYIDGQTIEEGSCFNTYDSGKITCEKILNVKEDRITILANNEEFITKFSLYQP